MPLSVYAPLIFFAIFGTPWNALQKSAPSVHFMIWYLDFSNHTKLDRIRDESKEQKTLI